MFRKVIIVLLIFTFAIQPLAYSFASSQITAKSDISNSIHKQIQSELENNLTVMNKKELNNAISSAFLSNSVKDLDEMLNERGFRLEKNQSLGAIFSYQSDIGDLVQLQYKSKDNYAYIYYTNLKGITSVA